MAYFDPTQESKTLVNASPTGLGGIFVQNDKIVSYCSRALSPVESRYSQTEREMLACVNTSTCMCMVHTLRSSLTISRCWGFQKQQENITTYRSMETPLACCRTTSHWYTDQDETPRILPIT